MGLKDDKNFSKNYLEPAKKEGYIKMKYPNTPTHMHQTYSLTEEGIKLKSELEGTKK